MMDTHTTATLWHYLGSFIFYTLLAIGVIYAIFLYLKKNPQGINLTALQTKSTPLANPLQVETRLPLEPRKNLYIVRAGSERFLIATGMEGTQFLSRLSDEETPDTVSALTDRDNEQPYDPDNNPVLEQPLASELHMSSVFNTILRRFAWNR